MTRLRQKLTERVAIVRPIQTPNPTSGGFDRSYAPLLEIWAQITPIAQSTRDIAYQAAYIRGKQISSVATHKMKARRVAIQDLGAQFDNGFSRGFSRAGSLEILKSEYYVLRLRGGPESDFSAGFDIGFSQTEGLIGNLFRILSGVDVDSAHEYLEIRLREIEEQGTGAEE